MEKKMKQISEDSVEQSDALFLARVAAEQQNRFVRRLIAGLSAFFLLWVAALLFFKQPELMAWLPRFEAPHQPRTTSGQAQQVAQVAQLNRQLSQLQQKLGNALTQTLSIKLAELEQRIRLGRAGLHDLELIESIRDDIRTLARQSNARQPLVSPSEELVMGSSTGMVKISNGASDPALLAKIARLENLLYFSLASFVLVTVAVAGYWLRYGSRLRRLDADLSRLRFQLEDNKEH